MATVGETIWAGSIASIDGILRFRATPKAGVFFFIEFQVGKWISVKTPLTRSGQGLLVRLSIPSPRILPVKVYIIAQGDVLGSGTYYQRERISWEGSWSLSKDGSAIYSPKVAYISSVPASVSTKLNRRIATAYKLRHAARRVHLGSYNKSLSTKVSPITHSALTLAAVEIFNSDNPASNRSYTPVWSAYEDFRHLWSSVNTPGFRKLKKAALPINNWSSTYVITQNSQAFRFEKHLPTQVNPASTYSNLFDRMTNVVNPFVPAAPLHDAGAADKALLRLLGKADLSIDGNLAQDVAQLGQTLSVIADSAVRIATSLQALHHGSPISAIQALWQGRRTNHSAPPIANFKHNLSRNWLELQYGWKPLLQDIDASMRQLANYLVAGDEGIWSVRGSASRESETPFNLNYASNTFSVGSGNIHYRSTTVYGVRYRIANKLKLFLSQTGFTNPINLIWEVLPFSFVVDWFLPIGPYLQTISAWDGLEFKDGFKTQFTRQTTSAAANFNGRRPDTTAADPVSLKCSGTYSREYIVVNRTKLTSFPHPHKLPSFKNPLSVTHAENGLALLYQVFDASKELAGENWHRPLYHLS